MRYEDALCAHPQYQTSSYIFFLTSFSFQVSTAAQLNYIINLTFIYNFNDENFRTLSILDITHTQKLLYK